LVVGIKERLAEQLLIYLVNPARIWWKIHRSGVSSRQKRKSLRRWLKQLEDEVIMLDHGYEKIGNEIKLVNQRKVQANDRMQKAVRMMKDAQPLSFEQMIRERTSQIENMKSQLGQIEKEL
jgi:hypothetical protein